jgi:hypothetical protein
LLPQIFLGQAKAIYRKCATGVDQSRRSLEFTTITVGCCNRGALAI